MYDLKKADAIYDEMRAEGKDIVHEVMLVFKDKMPKEYCMLMHLIKYGWHIYDEAMYNEAVSYLEWANGKGKGAKWDVDTLTKLSGIDFEKTNFFEYDFAYVANMLWSDYCEIFTDTTYYLKMAKLYLTDPDYPGKADERAYKSAMKRIEYHEKKF
jgi:hypothetical protein|nr:MAG TPA: hypothetical protein [Caudoviricetes sp.]